MKKKIKCAAELNECAAELYECTAEPYCALEPPPDLPEGRKYTVWTVPFVYFFCEKNCGNVWRSHGFFVPL